MPASLHSKHQSWRGHGPVSRLFRPLCDCVSRDKKEKKRENCSRWAFSGAAPVGLGRWVPARHEGGGSGAPCHLVSGSTLKKATRVWGWRARTGAKIGWSRRRRQARGFLEPHASAARSQPEQFGGRRSGGRGRWRRRAGDPWSWMRLRLPHAVRSKANTAAAASPPGWRGREPRGGARKPRHARGIRAVRPDPTAAGGPWGTSRATGSSGPVRSATSATDRDRTAPEVPVGSPRKKRSFRRAPAFLASFQPSCIFAAAPHATPHHRNNFSPLLSSNSEQKAAAEAAEER